MPVRRWAAGVRTGADYIQGVWIRLNGGGRQLADIAGLPPGLQMPPVDKDARAAATKAISLEISSLEKRLQESSKVKDTFSPAARLPRGSQVVPSGLL